MHPSAISILKFSPVQGLWCYGVADIKVVKKVIAEKEISSYTIRFSANYTLTSVSLLFL